MKINDIVESKPFGWGSEHRPKSVVTAKRKAKKIKPSPYGFSKHPFQNQLVGEATPIKK